MNKHVLVEICADSVDSAIAAERGGAHRIELCSDLLEGGITPSLGLLATVRGKIHLPIYAMIRPRGGDFCYTAEEFQMMEQDIAVGKQYGADGFVFGVLHPDATVDLDRTRRLVEKSAPKTVTFHRAFDMTRDLDEALETVVETGAARLLTSGGEQKAECGIPALARLVASARGRISIMASGGIVDSNVQRIVRETGVTEIHSSLRAPSPSPMLYRNEKISMGLLKGHEYERRAVREESVRRLVNAITSY